MDGLSRLGSLRITPIVIELETTGPLRTPEYKGALFRGGFGYFFRDMVCVTRAPTCAGCGHIRECAYSKVFETPVEPSKQEVLRKYPNAPHPFVLTPPDDERTNIGPGQKIELRVTLLGAFSAALAQFIVVLEAMGRSGRFGGGFRVSGARDGITGRPVFEGRTRRMVGAAGRLTQTETKPLRRVRLEFVTPLRMRTGGEYNREPDFTAVAQALLRRLHLLTALYGDGDGNTAWMKPLLEAADASRTVTRRFGTWEWARRSGRQGRAIAMDGVVGELEVEGDLGEWVPYLRAGEWVQVGNGTSMGLGRYRMEIVSPDIPLAGRFEAGYS